MKRPSPIAIALLPLLLALGAPEARPSEVGISKIDYAGASNWDAEHAFFLGLTEARIREAVEDAVRKALGPAGMAALVRAGDKVVIKPNIVQAREKMGDITDIRVLRAVCALVREAGAGSIEVVESSLGKGLGEYKVAGYDGADLKDGFLDGAPDVRLVDLDSVGTDQAIVLEPPGKLFWGELWLPDILRTRDLALAGPEERQDVYCDVLISIPVLKNHSNAALTCGLKGRVGCAPMMIYGERSSGTRSIHKDPSGKDCLNQSIVDLNRIRPSDLTVIDCLTGHRKGPSLFKLPTLDDQRAHIIFPFMIVASADTVAADVVAANLMGYDPASVSYIAMAGTRGLGSHLAKDISVQGPLPGDLRAELAARYGPRGKFPFPAGYGTVNKSRLIADSAPPAAVEILSPAAGPVLAGKAVPVKVRATDSVGIARIALFAGEEEIGVLRFDSARTAEGEIPWSPSGPGEHVLKAVAVDGFFQGASSEAVAVRAVESFAFLRGDPNGDGSVDVSDAVRVLFALFAGQGPLPCADAGDADDSGILDLSDPIRILEFLFQGAAAPPFPFPDCGDDSSADSLDCAANLCP